MACGEGACGVPAVGYEGLGRPWRLSEVGSARGVACNGNANLVSGPRATCIRAGTPTAATVRGPGPAGPPTRVPCADAALRKTRSLNYV
jgi:hypothetical protein